MKTSAIGWTDFSGGDLNFVTGCTPVSEGCQNCYARAIYKRWGRDFDTVTIHEDKLHRLYRRMSGGYSPKRGPGHWPMAFVCDTGDLFHPDVPDEFILSAVTMMAYREDVSWQVLTKRPERMRDWYAQYGYQYQLGGESNIWLGVTAENQARADERIPLLLDTPAAVRFVSVEPMLGPVDLRRYLRGAQHLSWLICGAESGPRRRPFDIQWARDLWVYCHCAGVAYFGKQDSGLKPGTPLLVGDGDTVIHEWPQ